MASVTLPRLISHQEYSAYEDERRLIRIDEKKILVTHFIDFKLTKLGQVVAKVQEQRRVDSIITEKVRVPGDKIFYLADRSLVVHDPIAPLMLPAAAVSLNQVSNQEEIISNLRARSVVVVDINIDQLFYDRLKNGKMPNPKTNESYILIAPEPQDKPLPPLNFSSSTQETTPPGASPAFRLSYEASFEAASPTAYQQPSL